MKKIVLILICLLTFIGCNSNQEADISTKIDEMNEKLNYQEIELTKLQELYDIQELIILELKKDIADKNEILNSIELKVGEFDKSGIQVEEVYEIISNNNDMFDDRLELYNRGITNQMINLLGNLGYSYREMLELTDDRIASIFAPGAHLDGYGFDMALLSEDDQKRLESIGITQNEAVLFSNLGYSKEEMFGLSLEEIDFVIPNTELLENLESLGIFKEVIDSKLQSGLTYKDIIKEALYD